MNEITTEDQWNEVLSKSIDSPILVFKHSTTCPISARASDRVHEYVMGAGDDAPPIVVVKVIESRKLSNAIASGLGVTHQSPQMILVKDRKAQWDASHHMITPDSIREALKAV